MTGPDAIPHTGIHISFTFYFQHQSLVVPFVPPQSIHVRHQHICLITKLDQFLKWIHRLKNIKKLKKTLWKQSAKNKATSAIQQLFLPTASAAWRSIFTMFSKTAYSTNSMLKTNKTTPLDSIKLQINHNYFWITFQSTLRKLSSRVSKEQVALATFKAQSS